MRCLILPAAMPYFAYICKICTSSSPCISPFFKKKKSLYCKWFLHCVESTEYIKIQIHFHAALIDLLEKILPKGRMVLLSTYSFLVERNMTS